MLSQKWDQNTYLLQFIKSLVWKQLKTPSGPHLYCCLVGYFLKRWENGVSIFCYCSVGISK